MWPEEDEEEEDEEEELIIHTFPPASFLPYLLCSR